MSLFKVVLQWLSLLSLTLIVFYLYLISVRYETNVHHPQVTKIPSSSSSKGKFTGINDYISYMTSHFQLKPEMEKGLKPEFGPVLNNVNFTYAINPIRDKCRDTNLFIVVVSAPANYIQRKLIRTTWAAHLIGSTRYAFLIGSTNRPKIQKKINNESSIYEDLIQVDMLDTYMNLTLKSVALLHWSFHFCSGARFILKCDDDIYINMRNLHVAIQQLPSKTPNVYGTAVTNLKPLRPALNNNQPSDDSDKWIVNQEMWPWSTYPTYVSGGCYLIDSMAIGPLLAAAQTTPYFPFEDLYVNGLCARKAEVQVLASDL